MPTSPSATPVLTPGGLSGVYSVPAIANTAGQGSGIATRQEVTNIADGTEDAYGAQPDGQQNGAIITEGWDQIGTFNERQDKETPAEDAGDAKEETEQRRERTT